MFTFGHKRYLRLIERQCKNNGAYPAHNAVFDNTYMKLFDARPSAIPTFSLRIKQFLTASNIELSDILETPSYFTLPPWCIKPPKILLDLVHLKKIKQMHQYTSNFSWKYETGTVITFLFIQTDHGMEILWLVLQSFHQTPNFP